MLDDVELANGPRLMMPGTHKGPIYDHHLEGRFCGAMDPDRLQAAVTIKRCQSRARRAGASFHHVRLVHGSAQNTSDKPRQLLLYECGAADAWPLVNFTTLEEFDSRMLCGQPTIAAAHRAGSDPHAAAACTQSRLDLRESDGHALALLPDCDGIGARKVTNAAALPGRGVIS